MQVTERAGVAQGAIEVRYVMPLSLVLDHRIVEGAPAAQFPAEVRNSPEQPEELLK